MTLTDIFTDEKREVEIADGYVYPNSMLEYHELFLEMELCEEDHN